VVFVGQAVTLTHASKVKLDNAGNKLATGNVVVMVLLEDSPKLNVLLLAYTKLLGVSGFCPT
jgi:hypothetical protein